MNQHSFWLDTSDGSELYVHNWQGHNSPKAIVMLVHGMAEHGMRYAQLGNFLASNDIAVFALDMRGHGQSMTYGIQGHFADSNGWEQAIDDLRSLNHHIRHQYGHIPIYILGHSLGGYLSIDYLMQYCCSVQGALLSGTSYIQNTNKYRLAQLLAKLERWRIGPRGRSKLLEDIIFHPIRRQFKDGRSQHDWLSSDAEQVRLYLNDERCGFVCTTQMWLDVFTGLQRITPVQNMIQIDNDLPIFIFGGEFDAISRGQRMLDLANALRESGNRAVDVKLYPSMRHEPLHEKQRQRVMKDILHWLEQQIPKEKP